MYLNRTERSACLFFAGFGLLLSVLILAAREKPFHDLWPVALIAGGIFFFPAGIALLRYFLSDGCRRRLHRDILRVHLGMENIAEAGGVQWTSVLYPDEVHPPSFVVLAVFLQNCHDTPRSVDLRLERMSFALVAGESRTTVTLEGGETAVLRLVGQMDGSSRSRTCGVRFRVRARRPGKVGCRLIEADGARRSAGRDSACVEVHPAADRPAPAYAGLPACAGLATLWRPGQVVPDDGAIAFLSLRA